MRRKNLLLELKKTWLTAWNTKQVSVISVEKDGEEDVWDIEMPKHHNFFANGILSHNCHGITPTLQKIVTGISEKYPLVRVFCLSATLYRMMEGYIYQYDEEGAWVDAARDPYFSKLLIRVTPWELIRHGYLTPAHADMTGDHYE